MDTASDTRPKEDHYLLERPSLESWANVTIKFYGFRMDGTPIEPRLIAFHPRHSPDGWSWGYAGSGPTQAALDILWDWMDEEPAPGAYQDFKNEYLADAYDGTKAELRIDAAAVGEFCRSRDPRKTFARYSRPDYETACGDCGEPMVRDSSGIARCPRCGHG